MRTGSLSKAKRRMDERDGICRLCVSGPMRLRNSHILPRWTYLRAHGRGPGRPDPVWLTRGQIKQRSMQVTQYLLCPDCETRLGNWEAYVGALVPRRETEGGILQQITVRLVAPDCAYAEVDHLDVESIVRFGVSVIWRAHVCDRPQCARFLLPPPLAEELRLFLLDQDSFPSRAWLTGTVLVDTAGRPRLPTLVSFPAVGESADYRFAEFAACVFQFRLTFGEAPEDVVATCLAHAQRKVLLVLPWARSAHARGAVNRMLNASRP